MNYGPVECISPPFYVSRSFNKSSAIKKLTQLPTSCKVPLPYPYMISTAFTERLVSMTITINPM